MIKTEVAAAILTGMLVGACGTQPSESPGTPPPETRPPTLEPTATASASATMSPQTTAPPESPGATEFALDDLVARLPTTELVPGTTAVCDIDPGDIDLSVPESSVICEDSLLVGTRVALIMTDVLPERLYLSRPGCPGPCSEDDLSTGIVHVWAGSRHFDVGIDTRQTFVVVTVSEATDHWPASSGSPVPAVDRPRLPFAPPSMAHRQSLPFCGGAHGVPDAVALACFRDAVLDGRPAEIIDSPVTGEAIWVYRFAGTGAVLRYRGDSGRWHVGAGALILGSDPSAWDFDPWAETERAVR